MSERMKHLKSNRNHERSSFENEVSVTFQTDAVCGSGKNISDAGVFFVAEQDVRVRVRIGDQEVDGFLVRMENHGPGKTGIAVRFPEGSLKPTE